MEQMTNGDRIRAMSDGELATWLPKAVPSDLCAVICAGYQQCGTEKECVERCRDWLRQPVE